MRQTFPPRDSASCFQIELRFWKDLGKVYEWCGVIDQINNKTKVCVLCFCIWFLLVNSFSSKWSFVKFTDTNFETNFENEVLKKALKTNFQNKLLSFQNKLLNFQNKNFSYHQKALFSFRSRKFQHFLVCSYIAWKQITH